MAQPGEKHHVVTTANNITYNVYVEGVEHPEVNILTFHDLGCNHRVFHELAIHPAMTNITKRAQWIHIDAPGQEDESPDLAPDTKYATMQELGEGLREVLDQLNVSQVVCLGEGAGANILARFAMKNDDRVLGVVLIHCTGTTAGFMEKFKDKIISYKLSKQGMTSTTEQYLESHRFGQIPSGIFCTEMDPNPDHKDSVTAVIEVFKQDLKTKINPKNLRFYVETFLYRTPLVNRAGDLKCRILLMTGANSSHNHTVFTLYNALNNQIEDRSRLEVVEIDGVANVLAEAPDKFAVSFQYFLQGIGKMGHVSMTNVTRKSSVGQRGRSMSMEEADLPRGADSLCSMAARKSSFSTNPPS
ncbi:uncharacterized protein ZK1073.1-like isoform X2 [Tubulanus polymorphus]|uniref:uncharacterized protein ZK1073.1-like isoform X2 n=1 Tax=Tubulanus polymorphus TaxID=672921 RepID=UPI003DA1F630